MASRDLSAVFETTRRAAHLKRARAPAPLLADGDALLHDGDAHDAWMPLVDAMHADLNYLHAQLRELSRLQADRLRVSFADDDADREARVIACADRITRTLRQTESNIKRVATAGNPIGSILSSDEQMIRRNVMRAMGTQLLALSNDFRRQQKTFGEQLLAEKQADLHLLPEPVVCASSAAQLAQLSVEQRHALADVRRAAEERTREITAIVASVQELASLFEQLQRLVVEQGSVLDRIDYNIVQARGCCGDAERALRVADERDRVRKKRQAGAIMSLVLAIGALSGVLAVKKALTK